MSLEWLLLGLRLSATIILYTFLGVAFYILWRELKQAAAQIVVPAGAVDQLRVVKAPTGQAFTAGEALPLQFVTLIGRAPENTIVVNDDGVSSRQARLYRKNGGWWLEDLGHKNGTKLNRLPLSKTTPLTHGDLIQIGNVWFRLETMTE